MILPKVEKKMLEMFRNYLSVLQGKINVIKNVLQGKKKKKKGGIFGSSF